MKATLVKSQSSLLDDSVTNQQDHCAADGDEQASQVEAADGAEPQLSSNESAYNSTSNPEQNGDNNAAWIASRHEKLGESTCDQSEYNPRKNTHGTTYPIVEAARKNTISAMLAPGELR
jgi:hypothetical protein